MESQKMINIWIMNQLNTRGINENLISIKMNVSKLVYIKWLYGWSMPTGRNVKLLCKNLGISTDEFKRKFKRQERLPTLCKKCGVNFQKRSISQEICLSARCNGRQRKSDTLKEEKEKLEENADQELLKKLKKAGRDFGRRNVKKPSYKFNLPTQEEIDHATREFISRGGRIKIQPPEVALDAILYSDLDRIEVHSL